MEHLSSAPWRARQMTPRDHSASHKTLHCSNSLSKIDRADIAARAHEAVPRPADAKAPARAGSPLVGHKARVNPMRLKGVISNHELSAEELRRHLQPPSPRQSSLVPSSQRSGTGTSSP